MNLRRRQIVDELDFMHWDQTGNRLEFKQEAALHDEIGYKVADNIALKVYWKLNAAFCT